MNPRLTRPYFSAGFKWTFVIVLIILNIFAAREYPLTFISLVSIPIIFTVKYQFIVLINEKSIEDRFEVLGIPMNKAKYSYDTLSLIEISKQRHSYTANTRSRVRQVVYDEYTAKLITDKEAITILQSTDYEIFLHDIIRLANELSLEIAKSY